jgi:hypothetical protein
VAHAIPILDTDIFNADSVRHARDVDDRREHMEAFGHMVWATMGPMNELFQESMVGSEPVLAWVEECCYRENVDPDGLEWRCSMRPIAVKSRRRGR